MPYAAWCKFCVMGRGRHDPHPRQDAADENARKKPLVQIDYMFLRAKDEEKVPVLCCWNHESKNGMAAMVHYKGIADEWNERTIVNSRVEENCSENAILRADPENAAYLRQDREEDRRD